MIDATALWILGIVAVLSILRIHRERRDHDREIEEQRHRLYKGGLL